MRKKLSNFSFAGTKTEGKQKPKLFPSTYFTISILNSNLRPLTSQTRWNDSDNLCHHKISCWICDSLFSLTKSKEFSQLLQIYVRMCSLFNWNKCLIQLCSHTQHIWLLLSCVQWIYIHLNRAFFLFIIRKLLWIKLKLSLRLTHFLAWWWWL